MSEFRKISPTQWEDNVFQSIDKDWMLITAKKGDAVNTMTASWGGVGILWSKPVAFVFLRPQRYTREFVDAADTLSLSFFKGEQRKVLTLCGSKSGRDVDKFGATGLTVAYEGKTPYIGEAKVVLTLKKLFRQQLASESFLNAQIEAEFYPDKDYHYMYVAEIENILVK